MLANKHGLLHGVRASTKKLVFATIGFQTQRELGISNSTSVERKKSFSMVQHKTLAKKVAPYPVQGWGRNQCHTSIISNIFQPTNKRDTIDWTSKKAFDYTGKLSKARTRRSCYPLATTLPPPPQMRRVEGRKEERKLPEHQIVPHLQ
jgi:hypothetical protein